MGGGRWSASDWQAYSSTYISNKKSVGDIYSAREMDKDLDPKGISIRESCDSDDNPNSTALIVGLDVTGSMGMLSEVMAREGLKILAEEVYNRKPITDPHIMFMGIGDAEMGDRAPLQVTQFEADIRIAEQLTKIFLEGRGGGNGYESYALAWYFAGLHTRIDCFEKRKKKGYLFTVGDENPTPYLRAEDIERVLGYRPEVDRYSAEELLNLASKQWEVFHLMVEEGSHFQFHDRQEIMKNWQELLGQRAIPLDDHKKMSEVIVSTIQVLEGESKDKVINSWDGSTSLVVAKAVENLDNIPSEESGVVMM